MFAVQMIEANTIRVRHLSPVHRAQEPAVSKLSWTRCAHAELQAWYSNCSLSGVGSVVPVVLPNIHSSTQAHLAQPSKPK